MLRCIVTLREDDFFFFLRLIHFSETERQSVEWRRGRDRKRERERETESETGSRL